MREKLTELLADFFGIDSPDGSYHYILNRVKTAFGLGTMRLDDFEEYDEDTVDEIVELLIDAGVTIPVRCKDCKYSYGNKYCTNDAWKDEGNTVRIEPDDFCSYGERKEV